MACSRANYIFFLNWDSVVGCFASDVSFSVIEESIYFGMKTIGFLENSVVTFSDSALHLKRRVLRFRYAVSVTCSREWWQNVGKRYIRDTCNSGRSVSPPVNK